MYFSGCYAQAMSLLALAVRVVIRDTASYFVVFPTVRKIKSLSLMKLCVSCGEIFKWNDLRFHSWRRYDSGSEN